MRTDIYDFILTHIKQILCFNSTNVKYNPQIVFDSLIFILKKQSSSKSTNEKYSIYFSHFLAKFETKIFDKNIKREDIIEHLQSVENNSKENVKTKVQDMKNDDYCDKE
jgi:hypothetical protein